MANIKFSQFTAEADINNFDGIVGYDGANNVRIAPSDLISTLGFLPLTAGSTVPLTGDLYMAPAGAVASTGSNAIVFRGINDGGTELSAAEIFTLDSTANPAGQDLVFTNADDNGVLQENLRINAFGQVGIGTNNPQFNLDVANDANFGGAVGFTSTATFNDSIVDTNGVTGNAGYVLKSIPSGVAWKPQQPGCQIKISGSAGLSNTTNGIEFEVEYNSTTVNDDATIFTPRLLGAPGTTNIGIEVLEAGRYEFFARYSTFDITQPSLPTVNGQKFLRITAAANGVKQCILQDLIVATSGNGEANVTGGGFMDLNANDVFGIIGFHTGATGGGTANEGFPVSNNAFFNEPMLWLVKVS